MGHVSSSEKKMSLIQFSNSCHLSIGWLGLSSNLNTCMTWKEGKEEGKKPCSIHQLFQDRCGT